MTCGTRGNLSPPCNAVGYIDRKVLGINHLYQKPAWRRHRVRVFTFQTTEHHRAVLRSYFQTSSSQLMHWLVYAGLYWWFSTWGAFQKGRPGMVRLSIWTWRVTKVRVVFFVACQWWDFLSSDVVIYSSLFCVVVHCWHCSLIKFCSSFSAVLSTIIGVHYGHVLVHMKVILPHMSGFFCWCRVAYSE